MPSFCTRASICGPASIMTVAGPRPSSRVMVSSVDESRRKASGMCFFVVDRKFAGVVTDTTTTRSAVPSGALTLPSSVHFASVAASTSGAVGRVVVIGFE